MSYTLFNAGTSDVVGLMAIPNQNASARPSWIGYIPLDDVDQYANEAVCPILNQFRAVGPPRSDFRRYVDLDCSGKTRLALLLEKAQIIMHPFVMGEVALGNLKQRELVVAAMPNLPRANVAIDLEVSGFIDAEVLFGRCVGYIDAHLTASTRLTPDTALWTCGKRLHEAASPGESTEQIMR